MNYRVEDLIRFIGIKEIEILSLREQVANLRQELLDAKAAIEAMSKGIGDKKEKAN